MTRSAPAAEAPDADQVPLELSALYRAYAQRVARWAQRLGGPSIDIEDVVQEVFLVVHRQLAGFRGDAKVTTWLFRITHNVVRHRRRRERLRRFFGSDEALARVASSRPTPVEELERRQAHDTVYKVLDAMSEKYRTAFILFELEGLSGEEIAALTGQRVATVWVHLHRARAHFVTGLKAHEAREQGRA